MPRAVVAVVGDGSVVGPILAELHLDDTRRHAEALSAAVDDVCARAHVALADLDGVGVGVGPGSFIGVRTGLSFALGLGALTPVSDCFVQPVMRAPTARHERPSERRGMRFRFMIFIFGFSLWF